MHCNTLEIWQAAEDKDREKKEVDPLPYPVLLKFVISYD